VGSPKAVSAGQAAMASQRRAGPPEGPPSIPSGMLPEEGIVVSVGPRRAVGCFHGSDRRGSTPSPWHSLAAALKPARAAILIRPRFGKSPGPPPAGEDLANTLLNLMVKNNDHFLLDERLKGGIGFPTGSCSDHLERSPGPHVWSSHWSADYVEQSYIYNHAQRRRGLRRHRPRGRRGTIHCQRKFANGRSGVA
jgi:hypothetical protein